MERSLLGKPARFEGGLKEVAPGTFAWLQPNGEWGESNAGVVAGEGEALLIDTLWDPVLTQRMLDDVAARVAVPITRLVNTHSDGDHVWGNQLVDVADIVATAAAGRVIREESPGALRRFKTLAPRLRLLGRLPLPIVGSLPVPLLPRLPLGPLGEYIDWMLSPYDFSDVRVTPPTREFSGELDLEAGGRAVQLIEVGPAHTPGDLIVHVPDVKVVFAADILFVGVAPVMWAGPTRNWIEALERILHLDPKVVVPGHGPVSGKAEVELLRDYLAWLDAAARPRFAAGRSPADVARELLHSAEYRDAQWAGWDSPERMLVTLTTIDRRRRGGDGAIGARERASIFGKVASLARDLERGRR